VIAIKDNFRPVRLGRLWFLIALCLATLAGAAGAIDVPLRSIAQITSDDDGRPLNYPVTVFYDPAVDETYIVNGISGRVVVYGPDFFPRVSIGSGRGVVAPRGGAVMNNGRVVVVQVRNAKNPVPRLTVLNGAFFTDMDISLDDIPEAADFVPREVAISSTGLLYLAGDNDRGALVLDNEGYFLRLLQPVDEVAALSRDFKPVEDTGGAAKEEAGPETETEEEMYADIPEEFRPRQTRRDRISTSESGLGPVKVNYVIIDSRGRIYLSSAETGKIYVFSSDEKFLFSFGTKGGSPGQMSNPRAMAIDEEHELFYVVDYMRHTILVYDLEGNFLFELGGRGNTPGWFNFPSDIAINRRGEIIVADLFNRRIQVLEVGFEESYFKWEDIQAGTPENKPGKGSDDADAGQADVIIETDDLVPGTPDITYEEPVELEPGPEESLESQAEPEPEVEVEVEIVPDMDMPGFPE